MKKFLSRFRSVRSADAWRSVRGRVSGFTLIELLVVIAIIALLASIILASLNTARSKARDADREQSLQEMAKDVILADQGLPVALTCGSHDVTSCTGPGAVNFSQYVDPKVGDLSTSICAHGVAAPCQYGIYQKGGGSSPTTEDYEICTYLENATTIGNTTVNGLVSVTSDSNTGLVAGCN